MFFKFTGCTTNNTFIILTLTFCILLPGAQLSGEEGNLLSVSCICAWAVFLCYTAVIKNPDATCNPTTGNSSPFSIAYGLVMTLISLCWAGWSYTAEEKLTGRKSNSNNINNGETINAAEVVREEDGTGPKREVAGVVVTQTESDETKEDDNYNPTPSSTSWKLNVALAVVSCWCAMTLTQWGVVQANDGTIANRNVGYISMWVIIGSQWFVMTLYLWTLIAPRIFPNRDFS
jgi:serine incorporator 1/3